MTPQDLIAAFDVLADAPDGVKRLRELVLSLAVRGKLVKQDPAEEPASLLLERIFSEQVRLHATKAASGPKTVPKAPSNDVPFNAPSGWVWCQLRALALLINGDRGKNYPSKSVYVDDGVPFINAGHLRDGRVDFGEMNFITDARFSLLRSGKVLDGDVLYCLRGSLGKAGIVTGFNRGAIASSLLIIRSLGADPAYLYRVLTSPFGEALVRRFDNGSAQPNLSGANVAKYPIPLPPLAEQQRIVARVDELMSLLDRLEAAHNTRDATRRAARDAALADLRNAPDSEATEAAWTRIAQQMDDLFTEPEDVAPLRQEVLQLAVQGRLTGDNVEEVMLNDLVDPKRPVSYGVLVPGPDVKGGVPLVRIADLDDRRPASTTGKSISRKVAEQYSRVRLHGDELLLGVVGSIGKVGVASPAWKGAVVARAVVRMGIRSEVHRDYVCYALQSPSVQRYFSDSTRTLAQPTLNVGLIRATPIPLPARDAQENIVSTVDALMSLCDNLEARLNSARDLHGQFAGAAVHHLDI